MSARIQLNNRSTWWQKSLASILNDSIFFGLIGLYYCLVLASNYFLLGKIDIIIGAYNKPFLIFMTAYSLAFIFLRVLYIMLWRRPDELSKSIVHDLSVYLRPERLIPGVLVILSFPIFFSAFGTFKSSIPGINPFSWDPTFMRIDLWLHGGTEPWRLLQPLLGYPVMTVFIDYVYVLWFFVFYGILFWQAFSVGNPLLRMRFLISFLLVWIIAGSLLAVVFSSAGPVYYGRVTGLEDPFEELMSYLNSVDVKHSIEALKVQDILWISYQNNSPGFARGISAMPSVHVALTVLLAAMGWSTHKFLGIILTVFAVLIMLGSIHLGWHYAIDGYFGAIVAIIIWISTGKILKRFKFS